MNAMSKSAMKRLRGRLGLTQLELARHLGVATITVSRWERGIVPIRRAVELAIKEIERTHTSDTEV